MADLVASATASNSPLKRAGLPSHAAPPGALPPHTAVSTAAHTTAQLASIAAQNNPAFIQAFVHAAAAQQQQQQQQHQQQQDLRRAAAVAAAASPSPSQTPPAISVASSVAQDLAITRYNTAVSAAAAAQQQHRPVALARAQVRHSVDPSLCAAAAPPRRGMQLCYLSISIPPRVSTFRLNSSIIEDAAFPMIIIVADRAFNRFPFRSTPLEQILVSASQSVDVGVSQTRPDLQRKSRGVAASPLVRVRATFQATLVFPGIVQLCGQKEGQSLPH